MKHFASAKYEAFVLRTNILKLVNKTISKCPRKGTLHIWLWPNKSLLRLRNTKGVISVKENKLVDLSMDFAVKILGLVRTLKEQHESIISGQIGRSGTSIGANIHEAQYAQSKPDFISKLQIALKESNETGYWLELLHKINAIDAQYYKELNAICTNIRIILISSINTSKTE